MFRNKHNSLSLVLRAHIRTGTAVHVPASPALLQEDGRQRREISRSFLLVNLRHADVIDKRDHSPSKVEVEDQHLRFPSDLHTPCGT